MSGLNLKAVANPDHGPSISTGSFYMRHTANGVLYCQITNDMCLDTDEDFSHHDCRTCNIPIVAAICRLSQTIGLNGRE